MKLAVIGASGLVGAELVRQARARSIVTIGAARNVRGEAAYVVDLADRKSIGAFLAEHAPTHVVVGSAWPYVDGCEQDPARSHRDNVETVANLIAEAPKETTVIFFSTDHVFDGETKPESRRGRKSGKYAESDRTHPLSVYAKHKLETENLLLDRGNALVVRTAWVFGEELGKKNFVYRVKAVAERGETLEVPVDQSGCPTWTGWLARTTLSLLETKMTGVVHATGGEVFTKAEWARAIAEALGLDLHVAEVSWEKSGQIAPRPARVALTSERHSLVQPPVRELLAALSL